MVTKENEFNSQNEFFNNDILDRNVTKKRKVIELL
jgi:hypothetical protein